MCISIFAYGTIKIKSLDDKVSSTTYIKSPLNYVGGKHKLLPQIMPLFPKNINTFVDLFSGGANVGINVQAKHHVFNDINHRVIEIFQMLSNKNIKPEQFVERIESRIAEFGLSKTNENAYLAFRTQYNSNPNPLDLFVLICFGFNYQIRFNNKLQFNNPFGRNRSSFTNNMKANLMAFVTQLQTMNSEFHSIPFHELDMSHLGRAIWFTAIRLISLLQPHIMMAIVDSKIGKKNKNCTCMIPC